MDVVNRFSYSRSIVPVPADLERAHRDAWCRLAGPGAWWTGSERLAIAGETRASRACLVCRNSRQGAPNGIRHRATPDLPAAAVELAHLVSEAPWRITREWFEGVCSALGDGAYVEAVGVTATAVNLDVYCRAVGCPQHPYPPVTPGEPTLERPRRLSSRAGWVPMALNGELDPDPFSGRWTPNVCRALSLVPEETNTLRKLIEAEYVPFERVGDLAWRPPSPLTRSQTELLAVRTSSLNQCFY